MTMSKKKKTKTKTILVVTAGIPDVWEPSKKELKKVTKLVMKSVDKTKVSTVLTVRNGVTVSTLEVPR
jgi:hypothetical protein